jgi:hypothetical protein
MVTSKFIKMECLWILVNCIHALNSSHLFCYKSVSTKILFPSEYKWKTNVFGKWWIPKNYFERKYQMHFLYALQLMKKQSQSIFIIDYIRYYSLKKPQVLHFAWLWSTKSAEFLTFYCMIERITYNCELILKHSWWKKIPSTQDKTIRNN